MLIVRTNPAIKRPNFHFNVTRIGFFLVTEVDDLHPVIVEARIDDADRSRIVGDEVRHLSRRSEGFGRRPLSGEEAALPVGPILAHRFSDAVFEKQLGEL